MTDTTAEAPAKPHSSHWGAFTGQWVKDKLVVTPASQRSRSESASSTIFPKRLRHQARVAQPMVRRGWLERGPGKDARRGRDEFVPMEWERGARSARRRTRARARHARPGAIFGGSYGWASAGRFHHAQSQMHRFLNIAMGGYVRSVNSYSAGASIGDAAAHPRRLRRRLAAQRQLGRDRQPHRHRARLRRHGDRRTRASPPAASAATPSIGDMVAASKRGAQFVLISPLQTDLPDEVERRMAADPPRHRHRADARASRTRWSTTALHDRDFLATAAPAGRCSRTI